MARGEGRDAHDMGLAFRRKRRDLFGRRKQWPDLDLESEVGEGRGDDLLTAVVSVLADLGDENARRPAFASAKARAIAIMRGFDLGG